MSILSVGVSGLDAAQAAISTTSNNISNVNTPGYSRQVVVQSADTPQFTGGYFLGQGTNVSTVQRAYSSFLVSQLREAQTQSTQMSGLSTQLQNIDNLLGSSSSGLSPMLSNLFTAVNTVAASPSDPASRQSLLAAAQTLAAGLNSTSSQMTTYGQQANASISQAVGALNTDASQVVQLNQQIVAAQGGGGSPPNDLMDKRDALLQDMSQQARVSVVQLQNGSVNVFLGNGQPLVLDAQQSTLAAQADPADPSQIAVGMMAGGKFQAFASGSVSGGAIGAAQSFLQTLSTAQNGLGVIAQTLATSFNAQQSVGQDLNGNPGTPMFSVAGPQVLANADNTGSAVVGATISSDSALSGSNYQLSYDGTNYTLTRLSDNTQQTFASLPQTVDGVTISLSGGAPAAGDRFLIEPTAAAAQSITSLITDPTMVAAAFPVVANAGSTNTGSGVAQVTAVTPPANANVSAPVSVSFTSPTTFNVTGTGTGNPVGLSYTPGMQISYNGWTATLNGTPASGDSFAVGPNTGGVGDGSNASAMADLQSAKLLAGGTASLSNSYAALVSNIGNQTQAATTGATAQQTVLANATSAQQSVSGVNLDEEAANLIKYQEAYQASAKVITTADSMFQSIIAVMTAQTG
jgi:flagellar hook-associated protein 1 FlgK